MFAPSLWYVKYTLTHHFFSPSMIQSAPATEDTEAGGLMHTRIT